MPRKVGSRNWPGPWPPTWSDHNVRVNALCPGVIDTPMPRRYIADAGVDAQAAWKGMEAMHLLKRVGEPEEVVWAAIFLASDERRS